MDFFSVFLSLINGIFRFTSTRLIMKAFDVLDVNCRLYFFFILFPSRYASITQNSLFWSQFSDRWVYWSSIYESLDPHLCISWTLYTFSIFILFLIFIFRLSLLLSFSSLNLAPVYIFLLCSIHKSHLQLFYTNYSRTFADGIAIFGCLFFFIFRLSMQYTHVIGELINSYARILSCVFWRQIQTEKKLSLHHL